MLREPLPQVAWWLNVWGGADPVTGMRGISHRFPWVLDIVLPGVRHPMENYLGSATVACAVGRALFGSLDRELSVPESLPEPEIDDVELNAYLLLTYAHFVAEHLPSKQQARFRGALEVVRADLTSRLGLTDTGEPPDPARLRTLSKSTALMPLARRRDDQPGRALRQRDQRSRPPRRAARPRRVDRALQRVRPYPPTRAHPGIDGDLADLGRPDVAAAATAAVTAMGSTPSS